MSRRHHTNPPDAVTAAIAAAATHTERRLELRIRRTGEAVILVSSYIAYRMEQLVDELNGHNNYFTMRMRNKANGVVRACDELAAMLEPYIQSDKERAAYGYFSEIIFNALDSLFTDLHRDEPEPTKQVRRRAALRYHEPYPTDVRERTEAFEDGYCKGYTDAMDDIIREVASISEGNDVKLNIAIDQGTVKLKKA